MPTSLGTTLKRKSQNAPSVQLEPVYLSYQAAPDYLAPRPPQRARRRPKKSEQKKVEPEKKKSRKRDLSPVQNIEKPVGRKRGRGLQPTEANNTAIEKETKTLKARGADTTGTPSEGVEERAARELKNDVAIKIYWRKEMFEAKIKSYNAKTGKVEVLYRKDKTIEKVKLKDFYDRLIEIESSDGKGRNKNKKELF